MNCKGLLLTKILFKFNTSDVREPFGTLLNAPLAGSSQDVIGVLEAQLPEVEIWLVNHRRDKVRVEGNIVLSSSAFESRRRPKRAFERLPSLCVRTKS